MTNHRPEVTRCRPAEAAPRCHNCRRWADHPEQIIGSITRVINATGPRDPACVHTPISRMANK
jgi:hypothetical protein